MSSGRFFLLLAFFVPAATLAQTSTVALTPDRSSIAAQRQLAEARHEQAALECRNKFAQTDCEKKAKKEKRAEMDRLRKLENQLNDLERRQKADRQRERAMQRLIEPERGIHPQTAAVEREQPGMTSDAERLEQQKRNEEKYHSKLRQAEEHRQKVQQAQQSKTGKAAASLPTPQ